MMRRFMTATRYLRVMLHYRWAALCYLLGLLRILPRFELSTAYIRQRTELKGRIKNSGKSVGHALGDRVISYSFCRWKFAQVRLAEGRQATAHQFFLNRPVNDLNYLLKISSNIFAIRSSDIIFDPGCGAGRQLLHLSDSFGCQGIGVDIYSPAIEVAETANWDHRVRFYAQTSLRPGALDELLPDGCDFVLMNSWLNHVRDSDGYSQCIAKLVDRSRFLLIIGSAKYGLEQFFDSPDIVTQVVDNDTLYAVLRGGLREAR